MTKATPAGRTLTDPPAVPGGNPEYRESGQYLGQAACSNKKPRARERLGAFSLRRWTRSAAALHDLRLVRIFARERLPLRARVVLMTLGLERGGVEGAGSELAARGALYLRHARSLCVVGNGERAVRAHRLGHA